MERRYLALMFTDIVGYSKLMGQNESQTIALVEEYRKILVATINEFEGHIIEFIGDAVFARFDNVLKAVNAGIAIQNALKEANERREASAFSLRTRIGIHAGEVTMKDGALFGDDVNIAARLEPLAVADGIAISSSVFNAVKNQLNIPIKSLGKQALKNIQHKTRVYLIKPDGIQLGTHLHYALRSFNLFVVKQRYPISACILALFIAGYYFIPRWLVPGYTANYVEIADFKNLMSEDGQADYFSAGITEALRSQLADIDDVYILEADKGIRAPVRLEGSVQKIGESLRIAYRLFRRKDNVQIAGGKLDGSYNDIFILQDRVVAEIARYLAQEFNVQKFRPPSLILTSDVSAYDFYLRGLEQLKKGSTEREFDEAIRFMSTALVHDKSFAEAYAGICRAYLGKFDFSRRMELLTNAVEYCETAWRKNNESTEILIGLVSAYIAIGKFEIAYDTLESFKQRGEPNSELALAQARLFQKMGDIDKANIAYQEAISSYDNQWRVFGDYAAFLLEIGEPSKALTILEKGLEVTPENENLFNNMGAAYFYLGDYQRSAEAFKAAVSISPTGSGYSNTGTLYYFAENYVESVRMFKEALKLSPQDFRLHVNLADALRQVDRHNEEIERNYLQAVRKAEKVLSINENDIEAHQYLVVAKLFLGDEQSSRHHLMRAKELSPDSVGVNYAGLRFWTYLKNWEEALKELPELLAQGYAPELLGLDPDLWELRMQPQYKELIDEASINNMKN